MSESKISGSGLTDSQDLWAHDSKSIKDKSGSCDDVESLPVGDTGMVLDLDLVLFSNTDVETETHSAPGGLDFASIRRIDW